MMRIRNNNIFVFLLTLSLGVLVAFYSRVGPIGYMDGCSVSGTTLLAAHKF